jgi:predicted glycoside hydrolase/deacetylase ChbG (UPF0249 family)
MHITLAAGRPLCPPERVPSLVDQRGRFLRRRVLATRLLAGRIRRSELRQEILAQVEKFLATGLRPSHVNGDQHVHVLPGVRNVLLEVAKDLRVAVRIPAERQISRTGGPPLRSRAVPLKLILKMLSGSLRRLCKINHLPTNDHFVSPFGLVPRRAISSKDFVRLTDVLKKGVTELMVHPAYVEAELVDFWGGQPSSAADRQNELAALMSDEFATTLKGNGLQLIGYSALLGS